MIKLYNMDVLCALKQIPDESVDMQITSPPYWGLRDYGEGTESIWDGEKDCGHEWGEGIIGVGSRSKDNHNAPTKQTEATMDRDKRPLTNFCSKCNAWKGQLGLEPDFNLFIKHLVQVFREVKRVLKSEGTCWINLGSTYCSQTIFSEYHKLRKDLNMRDVLYVKYELAKKLFCLRNGFREKISEGAMCKLLPKEMEKEPETQTDSIGIQKKILLQKQRKDFEEIIGEPEEIKERNNKKTWREMCLLWGDKEGIFNIRSYKRRREEGVSEGNGAENDLFESQERRFPEGQVQDFMLELQCFSGDLGLLSSLKFKKSDIPKKIQEFFEPEYIIKPKNDLLIPERFVIAMQEDGWILRNKIIWHKPNHMPTSVKDRFANSWEYLFLFSKSKKYYFDLDAVRGAHKYPNGPVTPESIGKKVDMKAYRKKIRMRGMEEGYSNPLKWCNPKGKNPDDVIQQKSESGIYSIGGKHSGYFNSDGTPRFNPLGSNPADFWDITTRGYPEAHFAVFPEKLVERPIKTTPQWICKKCGKSRERVVESEKINVTVSETTKFRDEGSSRNWGGERFDAVRKYKGWTTCSCNAGFRPAVILDIFAGSGTTLAVARRLGRDAIGIEIKKEYCDLIHRRLYGGNHSLIKELQIIT